MKRGAIEPTKRAVISEGEPWTDRAMGLPRSNYDDSEALRNAIAKADQKVRDRILRHPAIDAHRRG